MHASILTHTHTHKNTTPPTGRLPTPSARPRPSAVAAAAAPTPARGGPGPLVVIDNYDSFTYNLVQYLGDLGVEVAVFPNDAKTCAEIRAMRPRGVLISPGPGRNGRESERGRESLGEGGATQSPARCARATLVLRPPKWCGGPRRQSLPASSARQLEGWDMSSPRRPPWLRERHFFLQRTPLNLPLPLLPPPRPP